MCNKIHWGQYIETPGSPFTRVRSPHGLDCPDRDSQPNIEMLPDGRTRVHPCPTCRGLCGCSGK